MPAPTEAMGETIPEANFSLRKPGEFTGESFARSELGIRVLCAWNNIPFEQAPEFWKTHANEATAQAWNRVIKAVLDYDNARHAAAIRKPTP